ncbi:hypothetical protein BESB_044790 [Besnoitia besnoiti]|uniref:Uncharacterized protein n=1 Tax=Besnoitia besnoiti TaxID=94643 RepID=A0A2A9MKX8_BESBE|nr:hypothetical protein BESB_044790 [Besnoitia besnoiti]PFH36287.1 hypothetical protein BESB_044790 [Besnoitia besnoiti]
MTDVTSSSPGFHCAIPRRVGRKDASQRKTKGLCALAVVCLLSLAVSVGTDAASNRNDQPNPRPPDDKDKAQPAKKKWAVIQTRVPTRGGAGRWSGDLAAIRLQTPVATPRHASTDSPQPLPVWRGTSDKGKTLSPRVAAIMAKLQAKPENDDSAKRVQGKLKGPGGKKSNEDSEDGKGGEPSGPRPIIVTGLKDPKKSPGDVEPDAKGKEGDAKQGDVGTSDIDHSAHGGGVPLIIPPQQKPTTAAGDDTAAGSSRSGRMGPEGKDSSKAEGDDPSNSDIPVVPVLVKPRKYDTASQSQAGTSAEDESSSQDSEDVKAVPVVIPRAPVAKEAPWQSADASEEFGASQDSGDEYTSSVRAVPVSIQPREGNEGEQVATSGDESAAASSTEASGTQAAPTAEAPQDEPPYPESAEQVPPPAPEPAAQAEGPAEESQAESAAAPLTPQRRTGGRLPVCGKQVLEFEKNFRHVHSETLSAVQALTDGPQCLAAILGKIGPQVNAKFTDIRTEVFQAVVVAARLRRFVEDTQHALQAMRSRGLKTLHSDASIDAASNLLDTRVAVGDSVKEVSPDNQVLSKIWTVMNVHNSHLRCQSGEESRTFEVNGVVKTVESYTTIIADLCLTRGWLAVEKDLPGLMKAIERFVEQRGWVEAYIAAKTKGACGVLLKRMENGEEPTGALALTDAVRHVRAQKLMSMQQKPDKKKDVSVAEPYLSVTEVVKFLEAHQLYQKTASMQGCAPLSLTSAAAQSDLLGVVTSFSGASPDNLRNEIDMEKDGAACLAAVDYFFSRASQGVCAAEWSRKVPWAPKIVSLQNARLLRAFLSNNCEKKVPAGYPTAYTKKCNLACMRRAWEGEKPFGKAKSLSQKLRIDADFVRSTLQYERKSLLLLEDLGAAMADLVTSLDPERDVSKQLETDMCAASWFKRQKSDSVGDSFGFDLYNPLLVGSYVVTHARATLSATQAGLKNAAEEGIADSEPMSALFRSLTCAAPNTYPIASFLLQISAFLHVTVERAKKELYMKATKVMGSGVFDPKKFDASVKWIRQQVARFADLFMPGYLKGKGQAKIAPKILFPFAKMAVVMWMLGSADVEDGPLPPPFTKKLFAYILYNKGGDPIEEMEKQIKAECKNAAMNLPVGLSTNLRPSPTKVKIADIVKELVTGIKYRISLSGDIQKAANDVKNLAAGCKSNLDFNDVQQRALLEDHHCMVLQQKAISFLKKVLPKSKNNKQQEREINEAFEFLKHVNLVHPKDDTKKMVMAFEEWREKKQPYHKAQHLTDLSCMWKTNPDIQQVMVHAALGDKNEDAEAYSVPPALGTCPAYPIDPLAATQLVVAPDSLSGNIIWSTYV